MNIHNQIGVEKYREGDFAGAIEEFTRVLSNGYDKFATVNLGFISSFYADKTQLSFILDFLNLIEIDNINILKLKVSIGLALGGDESYVFDNYINTYIKPFSPKKRQKTIFLYHIPKCGGTTLSKYLVDHFYQSQYDLLPRYCELELLQFCITKAHEHFPYLSSQHMDYDLLRADNSHFVSISIFRDPVKRVLSGLRQTVSANRQGYSHNVIPKYGAYWNYADCDSLGDWIRECPVNELSKQLSTFSRTLNLPEAKSKLEQLNAIFSLDDNSCYQKISSFLGLGDNRQVLFDTKHNSSNKKLNIDLQGLASLQSHLEQEVSLLNQLSNKFV